jgi:acetolactate synthase-1/2/3 large subunit
MCPSHYFGKHPHQEVNLHADGAQYEIYSAVRETRLARRRSESCFPRSSTRHSCSPKAVSPDRCWSTCRWMLFSATARRRPSSARLDANTRSLRKPSLDHGTARESSRSSRRRARQSLYVGGGMVLADACEELRAFVDHLGIPVAHSLMGKGALPDDHPLLLGMSGFWGTSLVNDTCLAADGCSGSARASRKPTAAPGIAITPSTFPPTQAHPHRHRAR